MYGIVLLSSIRRRRRRRWQRGPGTCCRFHSVAYRHWNDLTGRYSTNDWQTLGIHITISLFAHARIAAHVIILILAHIHLTNRKQKQIRTPQRTERLPQIEHNSAGRICKNVHRTVMDCVMRRLFAPFMHSRTRRPLRASPNCEHC